MRFLISTCETLYSYFYHLNEVISVPTAIVDVGDKFAFWSA